MRAVLVIEVSGVSLRNDRPRTVTAAETLTSETLPELSFPITVLVAAGG